MSIIIIIKKICVFVFLLIKSLLNQAFIIINSIIKKNVDDVMRDDREL